MILIKVNKIEPNDKKAKYLADNDSDTYTPEKSKKLLSSSQNNVNVMSQNGMLNHK